MEADRITILFTRRRWNLGSWLIRWACPRSRFVLAMSSHCMIVDGDEVYEATMRHGVRKVARSIALEGQIIVKETHYQVPERDAGFRWLRHMVDASYDWAGALGLAFSPGRNWQQSNKWFCYELAAGTLLAAGRPLFENLTHVGETALMAINP